MYVVATAGHVDHGKSTLVRALTGMEPDRWEEERRRGLTIDLGFAWTELAAGAVLAFVDVPGHHRFISNMLAGVGPVAAVMFVVAADEGWCRQSTEHLAALHALGVRHGVLAVTRADLGDAAAATAEARERLHGTSLAGMEAVAVSPVTGAGLGELRAALRRLVTAMPPVPPGPARLWIDRAFTVRGAGTVVTGTLSSGRVEVGDELWLTPQARPVRVRGLQSLNQTVSAAVAVARLAVNLRGVSLAEVGRGQALVAPGGWALTSTVDVRLVPPPDLADVVGRPESPAQASQPVVPRLPQELMLHLGSAGVPARVRCLGVDTARLTLAQPVPVHVGERALLRDPGAGRVAAGLVVLDVAPPVLRGRGAAARRAEVLAGLSGTPDPLGEVQRRGAVRRSQLVAAGVMAAGAAAPSEVLAVRDWLVAPITWRSWTGALLATVDEWAAMHPMAPVLPLPAAARALELPDPRLLDQLVAQVPELVREAGGVRRRGVAAALPPAAAAGLAKLRERLAADPFHAPDSAELAALGLTDRHLATAVRAGLLLRVADGVFLRPEAIDEAARRVAQLDRRFTLSEARQALGTSRRVAVPLFELLDAEGVTRRVDERHRELLEAPTRSPRPPVT